MDDLIECSNCGRRFASDRIDKHESICSKQRERKVFDSRKARLEGTEAAPFAKTAVKQEKVAAQKKAPPKKDWRKAHEEWMQILHQSKEVDAAIKSGKDLSSLPPPAPQAHPDYVQCPYCQRRFNKDVADRHIPHCKTTVHRPSGPPRVRGSDSPAAISKAPTPMKKTAAAPSPKPMQYEDMPASAQARKSSVSSDGYGGGYGNAAPAPAPAKPMGFKSRNTPPPAAAPAAAPSRQQQPPSRTSSQPARQPAPQYNIHPAIQAQQDEYYDDDVDEGYGYAQELDMYASDNVPSRGAPRKSYDTESQGSSGSQGSYARASRETAPAPRSSMGAQSGSYAQQQQYGGYAYAGQTPAAVVRTGSTSQPKISIKPINQVQSPVYDDQMYDDEPRQSASRQPPAAAASNLKKSSLECCGFRYPAGARFCCYCGKARK